MRATLTAVALNTSQPPLKLAELYNVGELMNHFNFDVRRLLRETFERFKGFPENAHTEAG